MKMRDRARVHGLVDMLVLRGLPRIIHGPLIQEYPARVHRWADVICDANQVIAHKRFKNIIFDQGKDRMIESLAATFTTAVVRMAIGDGGVITNTTTPKTPSGLLASAPFGALYHEVYRGDLDTTTVNTGTPGVHSATFIKTFAAVDVPTTPFLDQVLPVINEVGLVTANILTGAPLPRTPVSPPTAPDGDEQVYSIRCFPSVPFLVANDISVTFRYTITIE